jgi:hypothetical protein
MIRDCLQSSILPQLANRFLCLPSRPRLFWIAMVFLMSLQLGCHWKAPGWQQLPAPRTIPQNRWVSNPLQVPNHPADFVWNQVVDTVDDYFQIDSEIRPMKTGEQWLEGKLATFPEIGSSYFEPWRRDTVIGFQRLQSTLQTMRRTAKVQVVPNNAGYLVEVTVNKDIEEVDRSLSGADGAAAARHDGSVVRTDPTLRGQPITLDWIEQERDNELEQQILREIQGRLLEVGPPARKHLEHP